VKIFIGADHRGFQMKKNVIKKLTEKGYQVCDMGMYDNKTTTDYPHIAYQVCREVVKSKSNRGILICMTGLGQAIAANKIHGIYASLCYNAQAASFSRQHNNANVLVLGAKYIKRGELTKILDSFLTEKFEGGRHLRRFKQIKKLEKGMKL